MLKKVLFWKQLFESLTCRIALCVSYHKRKYFYINQCMVSFRGTSRKVTSTTNTINITIATYIGFFESHRIEGLLTKFCTKAVNARKIVPSIWKYLNIIVVTEYKQRIWSLLVTVNKMRAYTTTSYDLFQNSGSLNFNNKGISTISCQRNMRKTNIFFEIKANTLNTLQQGATTFIYLYKVNFSGETSDNRK